MDLDAEFARFTAELKSVEESVAAEQTAAPPPLAPPPVRPPPKVSDSKLSHLSIRVFCCIAANSGRLRHGQHELSAWQQPHWCSAVAPQKHTTPKHPPANPASSGWPHHCYLWVRTVCILIQASADQSAAIAAAAAAMAPPPLVPPPLAPPPLASPPVQLPPPPLRPPPAAPLQPAQGGYQQQPPPYGGMQQMQMGGPPPPQPMRGECERYGKLRAHPADTNNRPAGSRIC